MRNRPHQNDLPTIKIKKNEDLQLGASTRTAFAGLFGHHTASPMGAQFDIIDSVVIVSFTVLTAILLCPLTGCGDDAGPVTPRASRAAEAASADTVSLAARVDGVPIRLGEVRELMAASASEVDGGLGPEEAAEMLIRNALLGEEARRRGYGETPEVGDVRRIALAKAILEAEVGKGIREDTLGEERLRKRYAAEKSRFVHGPRRRVVHFLALTKDRQLSDEEAHRVAENAYEIASGAESEAEFRERLAPFLELHGNKVKIESLPPFTADTKSLVRPFVDAAFGVASAGQVSRPVKTLYGWHVIYIIEELPAVNRSFEEVRGPLAEELLPAAKREAAKELVEGLAKELGVFIYEEGVDAEKKTP
jgi:hypothetical protein